MRVCKLSLADELLSKREFDYSGELIVLVIMLLLYLCGVNLCGCLCWGCILLDLFCVWGGVGVWGGVAVHLFDICAMGVLCLFVALCLRLF